MSLSNYLNETKAELKHVNWPTQNQTIAYTAVVVVVSVGIAFLLGVFDGVYAQILQKLISSFGI